MIIDGDASPAMNFIMLPHWALYTGAALLAANVFVHSCVALMLFIRTAIGR